MRLNTDPRVLKPPRQKKGVFPVPVSLFFSELFSKENIKLDGTHFVLNIILTYLRLLEQFIQTLHSVLERI